MTKAEIIAEINRRTGIERTDIGETIEVFLKVVAESLERGETVSLRRFGNFIVKKRAAKVARNILKNTTLLVEEHYIPAFKPSDQLLDIIKASPKLKQ